MARRITTLALQFALGTLLFAFATYGQGTRAGGARGHLGGAAAGLSQVESDAIGWLQALIRINTTNPPGNELRCREISRWNPR